MPSAWHWMSLFSNNANARRSPMRPVIGFSALLDRTPSGTTERFPRELPPPNQDTTEPYPDDKPGPGFDQRCPPDSAPAGNSFLPGHAPPPDPFPIPRAVPLADYHFHQSAGNHLQQRTALRSVPAPLSALYRRSSPADRARTQTHISDWESRYCWAEVRSRSATPAPTTNPLGPTD